jgi:hypothetical protein
MADELPFKVVRVDAHGHLEMLAMAMNVSIARGAYDKAVRMYPKDHIELRQAPGLSRSRSRISQAETPPGTHSAPCPTRTARALLMPNADRRSPCTSKRLRELKALAWKIRAY